MSEKEISEIKKNAEKYKESDLKKKELVKIKNKVINHIYSIKKLLEIPSIDPSLLSASQQVLKKANAALDVEDPSELEEIRQELDEMENRMSAYAGYEGYEPPAPREDAVVPSPMETHGPIYHEKVPPMITDELPTIKLPRQQILNDDTSPLDLDVSPSPQVMEGMPAPELEPKTEIDIINREALIIKKEILNYAYSIEQYITHVKLEGSIQTEAQSLLAKAHIEVEKEKPQGLGKIHKDLAELTARLDDLVGRTLGIDANPKQAESLDSIKENPKDDTKPFKVFRDDSNRFL